ncbi:deoxyguanosinetriphosphate triphosphohydrolase [Pleionea sediminis]|uniref:deoxyguanosinetriphosphate triphosphohydrolase n=1 Tax=Pleionea sediminis TaxID=2569479 RepID=UPI001186645A|nr:deoxyguanosinetriphosphate triphosphohydrolase [Pleionea sediminis]
MDWNKLLSTQRLDTQGSAKPEDVRNDFHKDYDRIIFSPAFRRMGRKTQVHPLVNHDHVHTRLTHSLEVASVGRSLGIKIGNYLLSKKVLPELLSPHDVGAIVQAACLAHDIGNPPFGHAGEFAIRQWFQDNTEKLKLETLRERNDLEIFEGNAQGFRVVATVENNFNEGGMRLTCATLGTIVKYPWFSDYKTAIDYGKYNFFQSEEASVKSVYETLGIEEVAGRYARHPLSYLMEAADDICYKILDIEDALELEMLRFDDIETIFQDLAGPLKQSSVANELNYRRRISPMRANAIDNLVNQCEQIFIDNYNAIINGQFTSELLRELRGKEGAALKEAKQITEENIFLNKRKIELELGAYTTLETILNPFVHAINELKEGKVSFKSKRVLDLMGAQKFNPEESYHDCYLRITDIVSGMTDHHATYVANQLSGHAL